MKFTYKSKTVPFEDILIGEFFKKANEEDVYLKIGESDSIGGCAFNMVTKERINILLSKEVVRLESEIIIYQ